MISNSQPSRMDRRTATTIFPLVDSSMVLPKVENQIMYLMNWVCVHCAFAMFLYIIPYLTT